MKDMSLKDWSSNGIGDDFENYINDLESKNIENVDHFNQLCLHQK